MNPTITLIAKRVGMAVLTLFLISIVIFSLSNLLPGDAAQEALGQSATPEVVAALRAEMGLDKPALQRYSHWLSGLLSGDPGKSFLSHLPVSELIADRLPNSLLLAAATAIISVPLALFIGILSAMYNGSLLDRGLNLVTLSIVAVPEFLVATTAVFFFAVRLNWLPALSFPPDPFSFGKFLHAYALPVLTLCAVITAQMARMTRAAVIDQLNQPYIEMAVLKGVSPTRAVLTHALPNAVGPIVNAVALSLSYLLGGVLIVEVIFNYPGVASLMVDAVTNRDMPLLQACAMIFCIAYLILVLFADVCAILANPKLRHQ